MIDESPRWLIAVGKKDEAIKLLQKIALYNKVPYKENEMLCEEEEDVNKSKKILQMWKRVVTTPWMTAYLLITFLSWYVISYMLH